MYGYTSDRLGLTPANGKRARASCGAKMVQLPAGSFGPEILIHTLY